MNTLMHFTPMLAMHGRLGGRGVFLLLAVIAVFALVVACWPGKSETK